MENPAGGGKGAEELAEELLRAARGKRSGHRLDAESDAAEGNDAEPGLFKEGKKLVSRADLADVHLDENGLEQALRLDGTPAGGEEPFEGDALGGGAGREKREPFGVFEERVLPPSEPP